MQRETKRQRLRRELAGERIGLPAQPDSQLHRRVPSAAHGDSASSASSDSDVGDGDTATGDAVGDDLGASMEDGDLQQEGRGGQEDQTGSDR